MKTVRGLEMFWLVELNCIIVVARTAKKIRWFSKKGRTRNNNDNYIDNNRSVGGALTGKHLLLAVPDNRAVPVEHFVAQPEVEVVSSVVQAGQRVQPDQHRDGIGLAVIVGRRPGRAAPAAGNGRPVWFGDVQVAVRTASVRVRGESADGEAIQSNLWFTKKSNNNDTFWSEVIK